MVRDLIEWLQWKYGKLLVWDATSPDTFASVRQLMGVGKVQVALAEERKCTKYGASLLPIICTGGNRVNRRDCRPVPKGVWGVPTNPQTSQGKEVFPLIANHTKIAYYVLICCWHLVCCWHLLPWCLICTRFEMLYKIIQTSENLVLAWTSNEWFSLCTISNTVDHTPSPWNPTPKFLGGLDWTTFTLLFERHTFWKEHSHNGWLFSFCTFVCNAQHHNIEFSILFF